MHAVNAITPVAAATSAGLMPGRGVAKVLSAGLFGATTALATLAAPDAFARVPPPIVTTFVPEQPCPSVLFSPRTTLTDTDVVPQSVVDQALCRGAAMAPHYFRTKGVGEDHNVFAPFQHPGRLMDRTVEALRAVGIEAERPVDSTYDWMKPTTAAALLLALSLVIMKDYRKRPLIGGQTPLGESLVGAGILLSLVGALHSLPYALSGIPRFNYAAATANYLVMGMWAFFGAWSLVASLSFRLPGPAFQHLFMRRRTQHAPFLLTGPGGKTFIPANAEAVHNAFRDGNGTFTFQVESAHLERDAVRAAVQRLGAVPVTATVSGLPREEFLTLRPMLKAMQKSKQPFTITTKRTRNLRNDELPQNDRATLLAGSRLPDRALAQSLVGKTLVGGMLVDAKKAEDGLAYWQEDDRYPEGRVAVTRCDIPVKVLRTGGEILSGVLSEEQTLPWPPKKLPQNGSYTVTCDGAADTLLPALADGIARRPILNDRSVKALLFRVAGINFLPAEVRRALHRAIWPTNVEIAWRQAPEGAAAYDDLATIAGQERYAVQPQSPLVPVSRAAIESIGGDALTLAMKATDWERQAAWFCAAMGLTTVEEFPDDATMVTFHVPAAAARSALNDDASPFAALARTQAVRLAIPMPLLAPKDVAALTRHEEIAIRIPAGNTTSLDDLLHPKRRAQPSAGRFLRGLGTVGRSTRQGVTNGRMPAIAALTTVGVPIAAPVTITTKALVGYTDAATWVVSGLRLFVSGGINTIFLPVMRSWFGAHRLNNYLYYMPGLFILALVYETANDVMHDEPERMWYKMLAEDVSYEGRSEERARELADLHAQEPRVGDRRFAINFRLGNLLPTGYYTAEDARLLMGMYAELHGDADAEARFLAGLMHDPGFVYLVQQDERAQALFTREVASHQPGIRAVLAGRPEIDPDGLFTAWGSVQPGKVAHGATARAHHTVPGTKIRSAQHVRHEGGFVPRRREQQVAAFVNHGGNRRKWR